MRTLNKMKLRMKTMTTVKTIAKTLLVSAVVSSAMGAERGNYFRVWQGFASPSLGETKLEQDLRMQEILPQFMSDTLDIYPQALNNYMVLIPPTNHPDYIPDEFALVALSSREDYLQIRSSPEGQAYSQAHWDLFDKTNSRSADPMVNFNIETPVSLQSGKSYDMIGNAIDWRQGYTVAFIGTRKSHLSAEQFLQRLLSHVQMTKDAMLGQGLKGYIFIANENYEVAYLNWESKEAHDLAGTTAKAHAAFADAQEIMDVLMYKEATPYSRGDEVGPGNFYSTLSVAQ